VALNTITLTVFFSNLQSIQEKTSDIVINIIFQPPPLQIGKYQVVDTNGYNIITLTLIFEINYVDMIIVCNNDMYNAH
jgi:hypothetical protein